jgi:hypothetical protein
VTDAVEQYRELITAWAAHGVVSSHRIQQASRHNAVGGDAVFE